MPADSRWQVKLVTLRTRDSYFESDVTYEYQVSYRSNGKQVYAFGRSEYEDDRGSRDSGAASVTIADDDASLTVKFEDGSEETHPLPPTE